MSSEFLWYRDQQDLKIGDVHRYVFEYTTLDEAKESIYLRIKNLENTGLRAIHLLNGPFILYCHIIPNNFSHKKAFDVENPGSDPEVHFKNTLKPGQTFNVRLYLNENSILQTNEDGSMTYRWSCDIISQIVINRKATVKYDLMMGTDLVHMRRLNRSAITSMTKGDFVPLEVEEPKIEIGTITNPNLKVQSLFTDDIWTVHPKDPHKPVHLIVITHGLFSNLTADMLYLRDQLASIDSDNVVILGYRGNAGRTEKGIRKLGEGVSWYVTDLIKRLESSRITISDISFVGHSLGGPIQLFALKHILQVHGDDYFKEHGINLRHFVCMASPMLGVLTEMNLWIAWFLDLGTLGKTGRDLTLLKRFHPFNKGKGESFCPVLETLPDDPVKSALQEFDLLTVYANAVNDGIVPLRTSSLLYLDWAAMGNVNDLRSFPNHLNEMHPSVLTETNASGHDVGEVPIDEDNPKFNSPQGKRQKKSMSPSTNNPTLSEMKTRNGPLSSRRARWYAQFSAKSSHLLSLDDSSEMEEQDENEEADGELFVPPKASAVESAINTLICPVPSKRFIMDPSTRNSCIFHDRFYHFDKIPDDELEQSHGFFKRLLNLKDWRIEKQVKIARKYHCQGMSWRKVLVFLPPDAHNNIVVRRRFANGFGWGVVDHLKEEIFGGEHLMAKI